MSNKKVLQVVGFLGKGGDTTAIVNIMNYFEENNYDIKFDFLTYERFNKDVYNEIKKNHDIFIFKNHFCVKHPLQYYYKLRKILKNNNYDAIQFHTSFQSCIGLIVAKRCGIKKRICYSHTTAVQRKINFFIKIVVLPLCRMIINKYATTKVSCSKEAGYFLFGNKSEFNIIYNGLNINKIRQYDRNNVKMIRKKYNINSDSIVIGQVGRFDENKNQAFTVEMAKVLNDKKYIFLLLGDGPKYQEIKDMISGEKIENVHLVGYVDCANDYMRLFNYLLQPSKYGEGLPVTLIEQQIVNEKCLCLSSNIVTLEANLGSVIYLPLDDKTKWIDTIVKGNNTCKLNNVQLFDISNTANDWAKLYK